MKNLKEIIQGAKKKDQKAFKILFDMHWDYLYGFMLKAIQNDEIIKTLQLKLSQKHLIKFILMILNINLKLGF